MNAYLEFLNENSQRSYPLMEDSVPASGGFKLPSDVLLDASGFSLIGTSGFRLAHYSGVTSGASAPFAPVSSKSTFFFQFEAGVSTFTIPVPIANTGTGARNYGTLAMPGDSSGTLAAGICVTMGGTSLSDTAEYSFGTTAPLEASLMFDMSGSQVNMVEVIRQDAVDYLVHGDVRLRGGYNMDVTQYGQEITLLPSIGGGELGRYEASVGTSPCSGLVLSIGGTKPNSRGEFKFIGGNRVVITDHPSTHTIDITATVPAPSQPSCST